MSEPRIVRQGRYKLKTSDGSTVMIEPAYEASCGCVFGVVTEQGVKGWMLVPCDVGSPCAAQVMLERLRREVDAGGPAKPLHLVTSAKDVRRRVAEAGRGDAP